MTIFATTLTSNQLITLYLKAPVGDRSDNGINKLETNVSLYRFVYSVDSWNSKHHPRNPFGMLQASVDDQPMSASERVQAPTSFLAV